MTTAEKFKQLLPREVNATSDSELNVIHDERLALYGLDPKGFEQAFMDNAKRTLAEAKQLKIKEQLAELEPIVSMAYIAEHYFGKTTSWISQRINNSIVNGKPAEFKPAEIDTLNAAFQDIAKKIGEVNIRY